MSREGHLEAMRLWRMLDEMDPAERLDRIRDEGSEVNTTPASAKLTAVVFRQLGIEVDEWDTYWEKLYGRPVGRVREFCDYAGESKPKLRVAILTRFAAQVQPLGEIAGGENNPPASPRKSSYEPEPRSQGEPSPEPRKQGQLRGGQANRLRKAIEKAGRNAHKFEKKFGPIDELDEATFSTWVGALEGEIAETANLTGNGLTQEEEREIEQHHVSDDSLHERNRLAHEVARRAIEYRRASVQHEEGDLPEAFVVEAAERLDEAVKRYEIHEVHEDNERGE